jgi:DivIVA domain-containing protein
VVGGQDPHASEPPEQSPAPSEEGNSTLRRLRSEVPGELRDVSFPTAVRGYDRRLVDEYVKQVNQVIAELEVSRSPQAAVKHALDRVGEQTSGVLQRAREVAEELTSTALADAEQATREAQEQAEQLLEDARMQAHQMRGEAKEQADHILAKARAEAAERTRHSEERLAALEKQGELRLAELQAQAEAAAGARQRLLADLRRTAAELEAVANRADAPTDAPATLAQGQLDEDDARAPTARVTTRRNRQSAPLEADDAPAEAAT